MRFRRMVGLTAVSAISGLMVLAVPAQAAVPTVTVANKCGFVEITVVSDIITTADMGLYAGAGGRNNVPVAVGTNVFTMVANPGDTGWVDVNVGDSAVRAGITYVKPDGCSQPVLKFDYQHGCDGRSVVAIKNTGDAAAEHLSVYRVNASNPYNIVKEPVLSDATIAVGTTYMAVDRLGNPFSTIGIERGTTAAAAHNITDGALFKPAVNCSDAPKVTLTATCAGIDISTDPADVAVQTAVRGRPQAPVRSGTTTSVAMSAGEALTVSTSAGIVAADVYTRPAACDAIQLPSATAAPLPVTGARTSWLIAGGVLLLLIGVAATTFARRRRTN